MFLDPKFFYFNLSTMLLFIWYIVPYFSITDHLLQKNYTEADGANLISVIGVFNTIGMVILGYIGDKPWLNVSKVYAVCLVGNIMKNFVLLCIRYEPNILFPFRYSLRIINGINACICPQLYISFNTRNDFWN